MIKIKGQNDREFHVDVDYSGRLPNSKTYLTLLHLKALVGASEAAFVALYCNDARVLLHDDAKLRRAIEEVDVDLAWLTRFGEGVVGLLRVEAFVGTED